MRNAWYAAAWEDELIEKGRLVARPILGEPVVLFRQADGKAVALEDRCSHRFAPLSMGKVLPGDRLQCPYHGLEFDTAGACVKNPHPPGNIPARARIAASSLRLASITAGSRSTSRKARSRRRTCAATRPS